MQVEVAEIDISSPEGLTISHAAAHPSSGIAASQLCKGDVLTFVFLICSAEAQHLQTAGSLIVKWRQKG